MHRVFVVDDDPDTRRAFAPTMIRFEYEAVEAENGHDALPKIDERMDLALLDVNLPGMGGCEVVEHLRRDPRRRDVPS